MSTESKFDDAKGRLKEGAGDITGDKDLQREGKADQAGAAVKDKIHAVKEKANDLVDKAKEAASRDDAR